MLDNIDLIEFLGYGVGISLMLLAVWCFLILPIKDDAIVRQAKAEAEKGSQRRQQRLNEIR